MSGRASPLVQQPQVQRIVCPLAVARGAARRAGKALRHGFDLPPYLFPSPS